MLTAEDKTYLLRIGHSADELNRIDKAMKKCNTKYFINGKQITREQAIEILGRNAYLAALGRSAFHYTTTADIYVTTEVASSYKKQGFVYFDTTAMYRSTVN